MITLRPYQQDAVTAIRAEYAAGHRRVLLVSPTGSGKCLGRGTPVLMFNGRIKAVEDVAVGDLLMGPDSAPRRVLSLARGREMMYRVTPTKGEPYVVNESHILSLRMTPGNSIGYAAGAVVNISVRDYLKQSKTFKHCAKGWRTGVDFPAPTEPLLIPAYLMGAWLGDGHSRHFTITGGDSEVLQEFIAYALHINSGYRIESNSPGSVTLHVTDSTRTGRGGCAINHALRYYRVFKNKHIPHRYLTGTREERLDLLAGLLDTDGSLGRTGYDFINKNRNLADGVAFLARSLGMSAYVKPCRKASQRGTVGTYYRVSISGDTALVPCRIARKRAPERKQIKSVLMTGIKVEAIGEDEYFGFEIDGDRLFLLGDFTVTHNTVLFSYITHHAAAKRQRVWILAHRVELLDQISRTLGEFGTRHGFIAAGYPAYKDALVQVAGVFTVARRLPGQRVAFHHRVAPPDLIICDEAHHATNATTWGRILSAFPRARVLGVTATPCRLDGTGLRECFDAMVLGPSVAELTAQGALVPLKAYAPASIATEGLHTRAGEFIASELAVRADNATVTGDAVAHYRRLADGKAAVAFCVSVEHARHVAESFTVAGIPAQSVDGTMDRTVRRAVIEAFVKGQIRVLTSCDLVSEGFDVPRVEVGISLRPTQSTGLWLQQVGRILRPSPGKSHAVLLDHAGNIARHGLPEDERDWSLDGLAPKTRAANEVADVAMRVCGSCYAAVRGRPVACPECGVAFPVQARTVDVADGELAEVTRETRRPLTPERRATLREQGQATEYEALVALGTKRGMKNPSGWAKHVMEARAAKAAREGKLTQGVA